MKTFAITTAILILVSCNGLARTWTSADGKKTFEGTLRSYNPTTGIVTVVLENGSPIEFEKSVLSPGDIEFLSSAGNVSGAEMPKGPDTETKIGKLVAKAKLHRIEGDRYKRADLEKSPEYYLLYYSASW